MALSATPTTVDETATRPAGPASSRPSKARRTAVVVSGILACAMPVMFTASLTGMLLTGTDADHRFHQLTGQGLLLCALWLGGLLPLLRAGWAGRRPPVAATWLHLTFAVVGAGCAVAAPGGGAPFLLGVVIGTGALVWWAMPVTPRLAVGPLALDPVLTPVALLSAALFAPYALDQIVQQNQAVGHHAENPHLFDMAWVVLVLVVAAAVASVVEAARRLMLWAAAGSLVIGAAGLLCGEPVTWSLLALGLGVLAGAAFILRTRLGRNH